jgi:hypothetical protein
MDVLLFASATKVLAPDPEIGYPEIEGNCLLKPDDPNL